MSQPARAHLADAKRRLFAAEYELPGRRLQLSVADLLEARAGMPQASVDELVKAATSGIEDGPVALVAQEPELRRRQTPPVTSVEDAARTALAGLAADLDLG